MQSCFDVYEVSVSKINIETYQLTLVLATITLQKYIELVKIKKNSILFNSWQPETFASSALADSSQI